MELKAIPLSKIRPNDWNPNVLDERKFDALVKQIKGAGFRQPLVVRPGKKKGTYEIIDGEHRCAALKSLGKKKADCIVVEDDDTEAKIQTLAMNVLRGDPDMFKMAKLIVQLNEECPAGELAERLGLTTVEIEDYLDTSAIEEVDLGTMEDVEDIKAPPTRKLTFRFEDEKEHKYVNRAINKLRKAKRMTAEEALVHLIEEYPGGKS